MWINGPFEPGIYNNISIFCSALMLELEESERVEADDGFIGEAPSHVKYPKSFLYYEETDEMQSLVRHRHETINKRFKQFCILKQIYRHDIRDHGDIFRCVAVITQLLIWNGEPLFDVDYVDSYLEDNYYPEQNDEEEVG